MAEKHRREVFGRSVKELSEAGVGCTKTIYQWIRSGKLEAAFIGGKFYVTDKALDEMRERSTTNINTAAKAATKMLA